MEEGQWATGSGGVQSTPHTPLLGRVECGGSNCDVNGRDRMPNRPRGVGRGSISRGKQSRGFGALSNIAVVDLTWDAWRTSQHHVATANVRVPQHRDFDSPSPFHYFFTCSFHFSISCLIQHQMKLCTMSGNILLQSPLRHSKAIYTILLLLSCRPGLCDRAKKYSHLRAPSR
jgi:hypothetical protein